MAPGFATVTLTDLLSHRAGLAEAYDDVWAQLWLRTDSVVAQRRDVAREATGSRHEHCTSARLDPHSRFVLICRQFIRS